METEFNLKFQRVPKTIFRVVSKYTKATLGVYETREEAMVAAAYLSDCKVQEVERWEYVNV